MTIAHLKRTIENLYYNEDYEGVVESNGAIVVLSIYCILCTRKVIVLESMEYTDFIEILSIVKDVVDVVDDFNKLHKTDMEVAVCLDENTKKFFEFCSYTIQLANKTKFGVFTSAS